MRLARRAGISAIERPIVTGVERTVLPNPAWLRALLADVRFAPVWLGLRVAVGVLLLESGWLGVQEASLATGPLPGAGGLVAPDTPLAIALTLCGIALLLGAMTGPAAFVGGCLGAGIWIADDPIVLALRLAAVIWLVLAWKTAGWIGFDRWLLPLLGMPWHGGSLFAGHPAGGRAARGVAWFLRILGDPGTGKETAHERGC